MNKLFFGDNLEILKDLYHNQPEGFIDLIYIDPPFNSKRNYNVLFESLDMKDTKAQKEAFADTWTNVSYLEMLNEIKEIDLNLYNFIHALDLVNISKSAISYLTTMAIRIWYMHKLLKPTGSFYLHCDPTMSHYLKIISDLVFQEKNFVNEIVWKRSDAHSDSKQGAKHYGRIHDIILFYKKSDAAVYNTIFNPLPQSTVDNWYKNIEEGTGRRYNKGDMQAPGGAAKGNPHYEWNGHLKYWRYSKENMQKLHDEGRIVYSKSGMPYQKRYLEDSKGIPLQDWWDDISMLRGINKSAENLGYPTQKPVALMERIIQASSSEGDLVADFFCGCGTTIAAAEKLKRNWLGADISHLAIKLIAKRLTDTYGPDIRSKFELFGFPKDIDSAHLLADDTKHGRFKFEEWIVEVMLGGVLNTKKNQTGFDGYLTFGLMPGQRDVVLIEVKSGNASLSQLNHFIKTVEANKGDLGVFVCFEAQVSKGMLESAKKQGYYKEELLGRKYDKIQILTVEDLMNHKTINIPQSTVSTFKSAARQAKEKDAEQGKLF